MKQYRIKTEAEFIEEFGKDWRIRVGWRTDNKMNYLFGSELESDEDDVFDNWNIFKEMITDKPLPEESVSKESVSDRPSTNKSILTEAEDIVNGARATDYGSAKESFERISKLANLMFNKEEREMMHVFRDITPSMVVKVLMAVKIARESNKHKRDNLVDLCGYAELLNRVEGE